MQWRMIWQCKPLYRSLYMILQWSVRFSHRQTEPRSRWEFLQESPKMKTRPNGQKTLSEEYFLKFLRKFLRMKIIPNCQKTLSEENFLDFCKNSWEWKLFPMVRRLCLVRIFRVFQKFLRRKIISNGQKTLSDENFFEFCKNSSEWKLFTMVRRLRLRRNFSRVLEWKFAVSVVGRLFLRRIDQHSSWLTQTLLLKSIQQTNFTWNGQKVTMSLIPLSANLETICKM